MSQLVSRIDTGFGVSFIVSAVIHLAVFLLLTLGGQLFPQHSTIKETYYVDIVNLPVAVPQSGSSTHSVGDTGTVPASASPMVVPPSPKSALKPVAKPTKPSVTQESAETESAFDERMAKLERISEARREEAVLEKLRSKVKVGNPKNGMPGSSGPEAGSSYADFIKSRLEDALKVTSFYTTKKPEVVVRLTIGPDGKIMRMKIERSSGDAAFELSVRRAIDLASEKFTVPPNHTVFDNGFVFKPKSISNTIYR
jgi:colicin import membrane protein